MREDMCDDGLRELQRLAAEFEAEQRALRAACSASSRAAVYVEETLQAAANLAPPEVVRGLLTEQELCDLYRYVDEARAEVAPPWVDCRVGGVGGAHRKLWLHASGSGGGRATIADACPRLLAKLTGRMEASTCCESTWRGAAATGAVAVGAPGLRVRCVEFHEYGPGGGLTELGHTDAGSALTLSVQLTPAPAPAHGGRLTTTATSGEVSEYALARGDGVVFCSETVHNVTPLTEGTREALVIELWTGGTNRVDRQR